jgi:hypothetical protein
LALGRPPAAQRGEARPRRRGAVAGWGREGAGMKENKGPANASQWGGLKAGAASMGAFGLFMGERENHQGRRPFGFPRVP